MSDELKDTEVNGAKDVSKEVKGEIQGEPQGETQEPKAQAKQETSPTENSPKVEKKQESKAPTESEVYAKANAIKEAAEKRAKGIGASKEKIAKIIEKAKFSKAYANFTKVELIKDDFIADGKLEGEVDLKTEPMLDGNTLVYCN